MSVTKTTVSQVLKHKPVSVIISVLTNHICFIHLIFWWHIIQIATLKLLRIQRFNSHHFGVVFFLILSSSVYAPVTSGDCECRT